MNNRGQVVYNDVYHLRTMLFTPDVPNSTSGTMTELPAAGGAVSINDHGQVVTLRDRVLLWNPLVPNASEFQEPVEVGPPPGLGVFASEINNYGQIVGKSVDERAFVWTPGTANGATGVTSYLGALDGRTRMTAYGINEGGQVVGYAQRTEPTGVGRAFLWTPEERNGTSGSMVDIGGVPPEPTDNLAFAINNLGVVTGRTVSMTHGGHAFIWNPNDPNGMSGTIREMGRLPGPRYSTYPYDINNLGVAVGAFDGKAFIWSEADGMLDLQSLVTENPRGYRLGQAFAVNDFGQILAHGFTGPPWTGGGVIPDPTLLLLTPVPEPNSGAFVAIGAVMVAMHRTRKMVRDGTAL